MRWLAGRPWWLVSGVFVVLLFLFVVSVMQSWGFLGTIPVTSVLLLLLVSIPASLIGRRGAPRPPRSN